jgi:hypothetical protein
MQRDQAHRTNELLERIAKALVLCAWSLCIWFLLLFSFYSFYYTVIYELYLDSPSDSAFFFLFSL